MTQEFTVVGSRQPLVDSWKKVTGQAVYGDDVRFPNTLICRLLRSTQPHARIMRIDTSRAEAMPGVRAVVTGQDAPPMALVASPTVLFPGETSRLSVWALGEEEDDERRAGKGEEEEGRGGRRSQVCYICSLL